MEEQQILTFVRRAAQDEALRSEVVRNPESVAAREGFSPRVMQVVTRLLPHLALEKTDDLSSPSLCWWFC